MWNCFRSKGFFYWIKVGNHVTLFEIRDTTCYDINFTCIEFPKNDVVKSLKFELRVSLQFLLHLEKDGLLKSFKVLHKKMQKTICVLRL